MIRYWLLTALRAPNRSLGMMSADLSPLLPYSSPPSLLLSYFTTPPSFTTHLCCLSESSREHCSASLQKLENLELRQTARPHSPAALSHWRRLRIPPVASDLPLPLSKAPTPTFPEQQAAAPRGNSLEKDEFKSA